MVGGMIRRGYDPDFAGRCFDQIKGFGEYGFPESHAAAFAQLVYVSAWIKCFYPEVFCAALLNSQPMGFYAPAQLVRDAREHGVTVLPPDIGSSDWDCTLEAASTGLAESLHPLPSAPFRIPPSPAPNAFPGDRRRAVRLGLRRIDGFRQEWAERITAARAERPFVSIDDLRTRANLPAAALDALAAADAMGALKLTRREGLWAAKGLPRAAPAPLFAAAGLDEADGQAPEALPRPDASQEVVSDYETLRLSLKGHPVGFLRDRLKARGAATAADYSKMKDGRRVAVAGVVLVRQRPGKGNVCFITLEDETGIVNVILWQDRFQAFRPVVMGARMMLVKGVVQQAEGVVHLIGEHLEDLTPELALLSDPGLAKNRFLLPADAAKSSPDPREKPQERPKPVRWRHPRNVRVLQKSRDFH
jgi:error-prone DNA polymerase